MAGGTRGLKPGDIILLVIDDEYGQSEAVAMAAQFEGAYRGRRWRGAIPIEISRAQSRQRLTLRLK